MARKNLYPFLTLCSVGLSLCLVLSADLSTQGQESSEQSTNRQTQLNRSVLQVTFDPPGDGEPDNTAGGASRDGRKCSNDAIAPGSPITSLTPATHQGLTVAERPAFFVYVPQTSAQTAFFTLKDDTEDYYYQVTLPLPKTPGIVSVKLPDDAPALEIGKSYQWSFVTICGAQLAVDDPRVEGWIQRTELNPSLIGQIQKMTPLERATVYGADGIWYDTVTTLAELKRSNPNDAAITARWEELLKSVGLEAIASKPLVH